MKSGNKVYVITLIVIVLCFTFFFTTKLWCPDDRKIQEDNYNQQISVGAWDVQIGNAKYDKNSRTMSCLLYEKTNSESPKKFDIQAFLGKYTSNDRLKYKLAQAKDDPNFAMLYIYDIPENFYFVTLELSADEIDYSGSSSENNSSSEYKFSSSERSDEQQKRVDKYIKIDYRNINNAASSVKNSSSK